MKVLIWVNQFPTFSETFIRDHIIALKQNNIDFTIYCNYKLDTENDSLQGFETYNLLKHRVCANEVIPFNKAKRLLKMLVTLLRYLFSSHFMSLLRSLNFFSLGKSAFSLSHFFTTYFLIEGNYEIVHAHFGDNGERAALYKSFGLSYLLITTFHGYDIRAGMLTGGAIYKNVWKYGNSIIAIAPYNREKLISFGAPENKIIDLPNGIDTTFFKLQAPKLDTGIIKMVTVARLAPEKGVLIAMKAVKMFIEKNPNLSVLYSIIGEGPLNAECQSFIKEHSLQNTFYLLGKKTTPEVRDLLMESDIYLLPSLAEVLPTVLLEAQSCGLVIVATNVGAVSSMAPFSEIVCPKDPQALYDGLHKLLSIRNNWVDLSKMQRNFVIENYDRQIVIKKLLKLYLTKYARK